MSELNGDSGSGSTTRFLMGVLLGAVVGAGVSLLLAPRSGKDTREWLATTARKTKDKSTLALKRGTRVFRREMDEAAGDHERSSSADMGATQSAG